MAKIRPPALPRKRKSTGAYYNTHLKNIIKQRPISSSNLEGGLIVKMDYFGKTTGRYKTAFYLIINPNYQNYVHVFDIDFIPASVLRFIISLTKNKKLEDFIFSQTTFSYYNFSSYNKSLYNKLLPIMNESYRKLIRNPKYIRRTYVVDYDFGKIRNAIKPKFVYPNIEDELLEIESAAIEYDIDKKQLISSAYKGRLSALNPTIWSKLKNTDSWQIGMTQEDVRRNAGIRGKSMETTNRIIAGMKSSQTFYAPIILKYKEDFYCVSGNTRLMTAMALKIIPTVYIFTYSEENT
jgi:hypothetical protein